MMEAYVGAAPGHEQAQFPLLPVGVALAGAAAAVASKTVAGRGAFATFS